MDSSGNLYGTTIAGGTSGRGTLFKIDTHGRTTVLFSFPGGTGGSSPTDSNVLIDGKGNIYGTAHGGENGYGIIYRLSPDGVYTVLHNFVYEEGRSQSGRLIMDSAGSIYGTAFKGGARGGYGTVYKLSF